MKVRKTGRRAVGKAARLTAGAHPPVVPFSRLLVLLVAVTFAGLPHLASAQDSYLLYVASESADEVSLVRFTPPATLSVEKVIPVGFWPAEMEGPHGVSVAPDGRYWYVSLGHGFPFGSLLKYATGADTLVARVELGLFPATVDLTLGGHMAFVVNANFHGDHVPSSVSVIDTDLMMEVDRLETCTMPHGSRVSADGLRHYSACMMDDRLVEIDTRTLEVTRMLEVGPHDAHHEAAAPQVCSPTWAAPSPDGTVVFVTCNKGQEILEVSVADWTVMRRFPSPGAPYNAHVTPDGSRLLVTQKAGAAVTVWDTRTGKQLAAIPSSGRVTHGVVVAPEGRYAFVSVEGIGGDPGRVDAIDLGSLKLVASVEIGRQAGGIALWKKERRTGRIDVPR